jgi:hypothetical protein
VRIHRQWLILTLASLLFLVAGSAYGVSRIERASRGPAFDRSALCLRINGQARQLLGVITGFGLAVSGPVVENADGTGHADLTFDVIGQWRTGRARVRWVEDDFIWHWANKNGQKGKGNSLNVNGTVYPLHLDRVAVVGPQRYSDVCAPASSITNFHPS